MHKDLEKLIQLQSIDLRISEIQHSKKEFPKTVENLQAAILKAQESVKAMQAKAAGFVAEKKSLQDKAVDSEEALKKSEERLNSIKTNREYDAVHTEIEAHKRTIEQSHNHAAGLDKDIAAQQASCDEAQKEIDKVKAENEPQIADLQEKITSIDSQVAEVKKERDAILAQISKPALRTYEHIIKKRKNAQVLSTVEGKKRSCAVCHKVLESQLINEIKKGDRILTCQSCGSIFVWAPPEEPAQPEQAV
jgi:uncharacterized protein